MGAFTSLSHALFPSEVVFFLCGKSGKNDPDLICKTSIPMVSQQYLSDMRAEIRNNLWNNPAFSSKRHGVMLDRQREELGERERESRSGREVHSPAFVDVASQDEGERRRERGRERRKTMHMDFEWVKEERDKEGEERERRGEGGIDSGAIFLSGGVDVRHSISLSLFFHFLSHKHTQLFFLVSFFYSLSLSLSLSRRIVITQTRHTPFCRKATFSTFPE